MQTRIRRNIRLAEAPSHGQSIFHYDASSSGAADYRQLVREVLNQCGVGLQTCPPESEYLAKSA